MRKVTGGTLPAKLWHEIMLHAHRDKAPAALPGMRAPWRNETIARLPWNAPAQDQERGPAALPPRVRDLRRPVKAYSMLRFGEEPREARWMPSAP